MSGTPFFSLAIASAGFSVLRLSLGHAALYLSNTRIAETRSLLRWISVFLFLLSAMAWIMNADTIAIGLTTWLFCILAIAASPLILLWPYGARRAIIMPALAFAIGGLVFMMV